MLGIFGLFVVVSVTAGLVGGAGEVLQTLRWITQTASATVSIFVVFGSLVWRYSTTVQEKIFPYLGGRWEGELTFEGKNGEENRAVTLMVKHWLGGIKFALESKESTSRTLVVHAERDAAISIDKLYYVFLNERKEGTKNENASYKGLAIMRIEKIGNCRLQGDYFTEQKNKGTILLYRERMHSIWTPWM